jgi:tryptophan-rich sensory protein
MKPIALVIGVIFIILAALTATGLAHFAPAVGIDGHKHLKHTILFAVIAILCFVWSRMTTETATSSR